MPTAKKPTLPKLTKSDTTEAVDHFMATLVHPHKDAIEALRDVILGANPSIAEGIKWRAPSFRTTGYFATTHLRTKNGLGLILHLGAKVRDVEGVVVEDPRGLLRWLAKDRAMIVFESLEDVLEKETDVVAILRQWIGFV